MTPDLIRKHKDKATEYISKGKFGPALELYRDLVRAMPQDLALRQKCAELSSKLGKVDDAVKDYEALVKVYAERGELLKAISLAKVILQVDPSHHQTQARLAELYAKHRGDAPGSAPEPTRPAGGSAGSPTGRPAAAPAARREVVSSAPRQSAVSSPLEIEVGIDGEVVEDEVEFTLPPLPSDPLGQLPAQLPHIPLFSDLAPGAFIAMVEKTVIHTAQAGERLVEEGSRGQAMFAIASGKVSVRRRMQGAEKTVDHLSAGAFFGEMALVTDSPRLASIVAEEETTLLEFSREQMDGLVGSYPTVGKVLAKFTRERLVANILRSNPIFGVLSEPSREALQKAGPKKVKPGELVLQQGQPGSQFCIVVRGKFSVVDETPGKKAMKLAELREGDVFGELSLMLGEPVLATVRADEEGLMVRLNPAAFKELLSREPDFKKQLVALGMDRIKKTTEMRQAR